jgi:hypothetical protein
MLNSGERTTLATPPTLAGFALDTDPASQAQAEQLKADLLRDSPFAVEAVAAYYNDPADAAKYALVLGYLGEIRDTTEELFFLLAAYEPGTPTKIYDIDPGPLGGRAKCVEGAEGTEPVVACAWADRESAALIVFFNRDAASSETLFRQMRAAIQTRD